MTEAPPALGPEVFAERRRRFLQALGPDDAALLFAAPAAVRSHDVEYPYRQDNDFLYLTGFPEPEAAALFLPEHAEGEYHLFVRPRDPERETWTGRRAGVDGARERFWADAAHEIGELEERLTKLAGDRTRFHASLGREEHRNGQILQWLQRWRQGRPRVGKGPTTLCDPAAILHEMRLVKEPAEIEIMRASAAIARGAHVGAMRGARPGMREFEIEAAIDFEFRRRGAAGPAYPSIVAAGANATILHYIDNDALLADGDLLLIDAGAELGGYCSDVTRTFPVGARFTEPQRALYEVVLQAQKAAIEAVRPGVSFEEPHRVALETLVAGLIRNGLLSGGVEEAIEHEAYKPFYMHRTSHWLGLDVHDVGSYKLGEAARTLAPGMVLTVEPGLYVGVGATDVDERFRGIGIRIEDDVLVTTDGREVLSTGIPKEIDEIEALRAEALG